jgi:hypothetical protein
MLSNHKKSIEKLQALISMYSTESEAQKKSLIDAISANRNWTFFQLNTYHNLLQFMSAHPQSVQQWMHIEKQLKRIAKYLSMNRSKLDESYNDSGLPFTTMNTRFSHDILLWSMDATVCKITIDHFEAGGTDLNTLLNLTLPSVERAETTAGLSNEELLQVLGVKPNSRLSFLLREFNNLNDKPLVKDFLWDSMKLWVYIYSSKISFSRTFNRMPIRKIFIQNEILKKFDHVQLMNNHLPAPTTLNASLRGHLVTVIKSSLLLTMRETDPATYMDESTLRYYTLERGIAIAIYGMKAQRQLPLQSYIGYTLFKNGYPAAYGGSWIFGKSAQFGLNIFETFRGGESGYMLCQLLRVYKQIFKLSSIEIDAYQFGRDNIDGIRSGAFWFYYRYGFLPLSKKLQSVALNEVSKIQSIDGYRTSEKTLIRFTERNMVLKFEKAMPMQFAVVYKNISKCIQNKYQADRILAIENSIDNFIRLAKPSTHFSAMEMQVLQEVALMCNAMGWGTKNEVDIMLQMIHAKPEDPYLYNNLLIELLEQVKVAY